MNILLIYPRFKKYLETNKKLFDILNHPITANFKAPPSLGIPIISAMLDRNEHTVTFIDQNIEDVPFDSHFDLVLVNCFTPQANAAYNIGDEFKKRGIKVVAGGIHPSCIPEETALHFTSVVIGEVESSLYQVLEDAKNNKLKQFYRQTEFYDINKYIQPDRSIYANKKGYEWDIFYLQVFRGCDYRCVTCSCPTAHGRVVRPRPLDSILEEVQNCNTKQIFITDDTLLLTSPSFQKDAERFFDAMKGMNKDIILSSSMILNDDPVALKRAKDAGVSQIYMVTGFDPVSVKAISQGRTRRADEIINKVKDAGIKIFISVMLGSDRDDLSVFPRTFDYLARHQISLAEFYLITPYPGTVFYDQVVAEDRLLHRNYDLYNSAHAVFKPKNMTADQMETAYLKLWKDFFEANPLPPEEATLHYDTTDEYKQKFALTLPIEK